MRLLKYIIFIFIILVSCGETERETVKQTKEKEKDKFERIDRDSLEEARLSAKYDRFPEISYSRVKIKNSKHRNEILWEYREDPKNIIKNQVFCTLNRKARHYMRVGDTIIVPDTIYPDKRAYSVFPQYYHGARNIDKLIVMSNQYQSYGAYEDGILVHFAAVNSGKETTQTYPGRYYLNWKSELRLSSLDSTWEMPYTWNFHRFAGNAFHQFTMPGYPASHSCARQFEEDALWLYKWGEGSDYKDGAPIPETGTPVIIVDAYDFSQGKKGPWLYFTSNKDTILDLPEDPLEVEKALIPISQIPEEIRNHLPEKERYANAEKILRQRGVIREGVTIQKSINFNKLRREKRLAEIKKERKEARSIKKISTTDIETIKNNLEYLEDSKINIRSHNKPDSVKNN